MKNLKKVSVGLLVLMSLMLFAIVPVMAQDYGKPEVMVRGVGQFTTNFDYLGSGTDHRCFINLHARQIADGWTGQGVFWDKDYVDGKIIAIFVVKSATYESLPRQINYRGSADVYINDVFAGNYVWESITAIGEPIEVFSFQIPRLRYYAFVFGADIGINMHVR